MSYGYRYNYSMGPEEAITFVFGLFGIIITFAIALGLAIYLFNAIGLYTMSKRRGYKNAWLAFIPIASSYVLGGIADNINSCAGKKTHHRTTLVVLEAVTVISSVITMITSIGFLVTMFEYAYYYNDIDYSAMNAMIGLMFVSMALSAVAIAYAVFYYIACYKIFVDYSNNNGALFLVLSILFGIAPFIIFALRNKQPISLSFANGYGQQGQPPYGQPGQPMYQQAPPPTQGYYQQAPHNMYPQAPQPIQQNGWYQQAPQNLYPQAPQPMYPQAPQPAPVPPPAYQQPAPPQPQAGWQQPVAQEGQPMPPAQPTPPTEPAPPAASDTDNNN